MSCISRRAHADRYSFKLIKEENGEMKEKNYIWTEFRCPNEVLEGKDTCLECSVKVKGYKYQSVPKFDQGKIGEPYTPQSKLYGSAYYLKFIKDGWKIREEDERRAKEAQQKANMAPVKKDIDGEPLTIKTKITKKSSSTSLNSADTVTPKTPRKIKIKKAPLPVADTIAEFVESIEPPMVVDEVLVVKVKKIRCEGVEYYHDSASGKVYGVSVKGVGAYKGRYSADTGINTTYPDSDEE